MNEHRQGRGISTTRRLVLSAIFAALAYAVATIFRFRVNFLTFDLKDAIITVAGLLLGPLSALAISLVTALLEMISISETGLYGFLMDFASSATFSCAAAILYKYRKRLSGAILGLAAAVIASTVVMMALNLCITPIYYTKAMGVPMSLKDAAAMIPLFLLPFNLVKTLTNASAVLILYKPISRAMQAAGFLPRTSGGEASVGKSKQVWTSIAVSAIGAILLAVAILTGVFLMGGTAEWF